MSDLVAFSRATRVRRRRSPPPAARPAPSAPRGVVVTLGVLVALLAAHLLHATGLLGADGGGMFAVITYSLVAFGSATVIFARAASVRAERAAWTLVGAGVLCWAAGDLAWEFGVDGYDPAFPGVSDGLDLASYLSLWLGVSLLLRERLRPLRTAAWLDGLVALLALGAVASAVLFGPVLDATSGDETTVALAFLYATGDLALLGMVLIAFALTRWRPGRTVALIGFGFALAVIADSLFAWEEVTVRMLPGALSTSLWPAALLCVAAAAWSREPRVVPTRDGQAMVVLPAIGGIVALAILALGQVVELPGPAAALACAAILCAFARAAIVFGDNLGLLRASRRDALTDGLTALGNRRALIAALEDALAHGERNPHTLALLDLDGFKAYNDTRGHLAGDALLRRRGEAFAAVAARHGGRAYRLGGDEFCVLLDAARATPGALTELAGSLGERDGRLRISASQGSVELPAEADTVSRALQVADERMYRAKETRQHAA